MAELHRFLIEKVALQALSDKELSILLGGGKLLNELNFSTKQLWFYKNTFLASEEGPDKKAAFAGLSFFLRILAGHVFEAYEYFRREVRVDKLKTEYNITDENFYTDIKVLKKYFASKNIISGMRNRFSFHTDSELMRRSFVRLPHEFAYEALLGKYRGHNIFCGSETIIIDGLQHLAGNTSWEDAINLAFEDATRNAVLLSSVVQRVIGSIMTTRLNLTMSSAERVSLSDGPPIDDVRVPFFCQPPRVRVDPSDSG